MSRRYRLRGEVGGVERTYLLAPGPNLLGSAIGNDVVLPVRGVSRRHALVSCGPEGLVLEDLGSKNGSWRDGRRVESSPFQPGDEVRFGPVTLRLEPVEADDAELAFAIPAAAAGAQDAEDETTATAGQTRSPAAGPWLQIVEGFLARLAVAPEADATGALELLVRQLPARGACVVEWFRGEPVVLAASGRIESPLRHAGFQDFMQSALRAEKTGSVHTAVLLGEPLMSCAFLKGPGAEGLALVIWGDFRARAESDPLLRILLSLFDRFRPRPLHVPPGELPRPGQGLEFPEGYVAGDSPAMSELYGQMRPLLQGDMPVLVLGETGVGKEKLARILHASSRRRGGPFVAVNCAAIPAELLEAEMFGIGKGVATGVAERPGKFQLAEGGTLFLDEIGDMPLEMQSKLLRALQEKEIHPVGSRPVAVDIRVISATNSDLHERMEAGRFRRDLYYRVAGYVLQVPPLRQRKEDIPVLVESFVQAFTRQIGKAIRGVTVKALAALVSYDWPGNVRELEHEARRLVYLCPEGQAIDSMMLSAQVVSPPAAAGRSRAEGPLRLGEQVRELEGELIRQALQQAAGNRTQAAKLLGISRNGLAIKMGRLGIAD